MTGNIETSDAHDRTYYGNGCPNGWGSGGDGGSPTSCDIDLVLTADNENQEIGTYYDFQAVTSGTGAAIKTDNTNAPDTFCPLGWQLPYSGSGGDYYNKSRSWKYLVEEVYRLTENVGTKIRSYPFSYIQSGYYRWYAGRLYDATNAGYIASETAYGSGHAYRVSFYATTFNSPQQTGKRDGLSIRCDFDISNLESSPWHPRSLISIMAFHFLKAHFPSVKIMSNYLKNETKYFIF